MMCVNTLVLGNKMIQLSGGRPQYLKIVFLGLSYLPIYRNRRPSLFEVLVFLVMTFRCLKKLELRGKLLSVG